MLLFAVLTAMAVRTTRKGLDTWRAEGKAAAEKAAAEARLVVARLQSCRRVR